MPDESPRAVRRGPPRRKCTGRWVRASAGRHAGKRNYSFHTPGEALRLSLVIAALVLSYAFAGAPTALLDGGAPNLAYVVGGGTQGRDLVLLDVAKRMVTGRVTFGVVPSSIVLSSDAHYAYVTLPSAGQIAIVDAASKTVAATIPVGSGPAMVVRGFSRGSVVLLVSLSGANRVVMVNPDARRVVATIPVGAHPAGIALAIQGSGIVDADINDAELYVANSESDTVSVISTDQQKVIATIAVPGQPVQIVVPTTGGIAYVATDTGAIYAVSLARHTVLGRLFQLPSGHAAGQMDYDAITGQVYVPDPAGGVVEVLAPATDSGLDQATRFPPEPAREFALPGGPRAVAITFDGALGFVAEQKTGQVAMLDVASRRTLATIGVGGTPVAILTGAYPPTEQAPASHTAVYVGGALMLILALAGGGAIAWRRREARMRAPTKAKERRP